MQSTNKHTGCLIAACRYYEAVIEEILDDGACTITFAEYGNTDVSQVSLCVLLVYTAVQLSPWCTEPVKVVVH